nr:MAG TPA: hypothetical protein [Caudoviricetes sp.]
MTAVPLDLEPFPDGSNPSVSTKTHRYELFWFSNVFCLTVKLSQR